MSKYVTKYISQFHFTTKINYKNCKKKLLCYQQIYVKNKIISSRIDLYEKLGAVNSAGLKIKYNSGQVVQVGGDDFPAGTSHEFVLERNERIVRVAVRAGWMLDQLTFYTSKNREFGPYGGPGGSEHMFGNPKEPMPYLAGIKCRVDYTQQLPGIRHFSLVWGKFKYSE